MSEERKGIADLVEGPWRPGRQDMLSFTMAEGEDAGPWKNIYGPQREHHPNIPGETVPVAVARAYGKTADQVLARARLIGAAPEMYELLHRFAFGAISSAGLKAGADARALLARIDGDGT